MSKNFFENSLKQKSVKLNCLPLLMVFGVTLVTKKSS